MLWPYLLAGAGLVLLLLIFMRWTTVLAVVNALYPVVVLLAIHNLWVHIWRQTGVVPNATSPVRLGGMEEPIMLTTYVLMLASPLAVLTNAILLWVKWREHYESPRSRRWIVGSLVALACFTWLGGYVMVLLDPFGAIVWFLD
jgi:hypothetical protein